jgi:hypothetical protein
LDAAKKAGGGGIAAFVWLNNALTSNELSAKAERVSRQVARSEGSPRMRWVIEACRADRAFHRCENGSPMLCGRTHRVTREKSVKVKPYIRGKGDAVQIKDYVVRELEGKMGRRSREQLYDQVDRLLTASTDGVRRKARPLVGAEWSQGSYSATLRAAAPEPYHVRLDFRGANREPILYFEESDLATKIARVICEYFNDPDNTK